MVRLNEARAARSGEAWPAIFKSDGISIHHSSSSKRSRTRNTWPSSSCTPVSQRTSGSSQRDGARTTVEVSGCVLWVSEAGPGAPGFASVVEGLPSGAKAPEYFSAFSARLKSCPDTKLSERSACEGPWSCPDIELSEGSACEGRRSCSESKLAW